MGNLAETSNSRIVNLKEEELVFAKTPKGHCCLIMKPKFKETETSIRIWKSTNEFTNEFGHFIGMYIGDGWVDKGKNHHSIHIASTHQEIIDYFKDSVNKYLRQGLIPNKGYHKRNHTHMFDGHLSTHGKMSISIPNNVRLDMIDLFGHGAKNKTFPDYFLNTPEEFRWGLLSGLLDTDGTIVLHIRKQKNGKLKYNKNVMYSTVSNELANKVQLLSFSLGVNASITTSKHKSGTIEKIVVFSTMHITEKRDKLSFLRKEKSETLSKFFTTAKVYSKDIIPFTDEIYAKIKECTPKIPSSNQSTFRLSANRGYISRGSFIRYYKGKVKKFYNSLFDFKRQYELLKRTIQED